MTRQSTPEVRATIAVFAVVLASAATHTVGRLFDHVDQTAAGARSSINAVEKLQKKVDELESQLEELDSKVEERR